MDSVNGVIQNFEYNILNKNIKKTNQLFHRQILFKHTLIQHFIFTSMNRKLIMNNVLFT